MSIIASLIERITPLGLIQYIWGQNGTPDALIFDFDLVDTLIAADRARLATIEAGGSPTAFLPSQFEVITTSRLAVAGDALFVNTTAAAVPVTLPAAPAITDPPIVLVDAAGTWNLNAVTVDGNGNNVMGQATLPLAVKGASAWFAYAGATHGWRLMVRPNHQISNEIRAASFTATPGGSYMIDVTAAAVTVTLPLDPQIWFPPIDITHIDGNLAVNALTIARNLQNIMGLAQDMTVDVANSSFRLMFSDTARGWRIGNI